MREKPRWLGVRSVGIVLVSTLLLGGCGGPMQASELSPSVETLASSAADGQLLARGAAADRTKTTFVRVHARELGEVVDHEAEKLNDATPAAGVGAKKDSASTLAEQISTVLGQLQTAPADRPQARRAELRLRQLAQRAQRLADSL
jgi:hypothetical protein